MKYQAEDVKLTLDHIERMAADPDLSNSALGALVRMQFATGEISNDMSRAGVYHVIHDLAAIGWVKIITHYGINPSSGRQSWIQDEVRFLRTRQDDMQLWLIQYSRTGAAKTHTSMVSARSATEAQETWRHAFPSHQLRDIMALGIQTKEEFEKESIAWMLPQGAVSVIFKFVGSRRRREYEKLGDIGAADRSPLTKEKNDGS